MSTHLQSIVFSKNVETSEFPRSWQTSLNSIVSKVKMSKTWTFSSLCEYFFLKILLPFLFAPETMSLLLMPFSVHDVLDLGDYEPKL